MTAPVPDSPATAAPAVPRFERICAGLVAAGYGVILTWNASDGVSVVNLIRVCAEQIMGFLNEIWQARAFDSYFYEIAVGAVVCGVFLTIFPLLLLVLGCVLGWRALSAGGLHWWLIASHAGLGVIALAHML